MTSKTNDAMSIKDYIMNLSPDELHELAKKILPKRPKKVITDKRELHLAYQECSSDANLIDCTDGQFSGVESETYLLDGIKYKFLFNEGTAFECNLYEIERQ